MKRVEDPRFLTGRGRFIDNMTIPGMLYASVLQSPYAHARIIKVNAERAMKLDGVYAVITGDDATKLTKPLPRSVKASTNEYCLAYGKVRHVGEPVAAVAASDKYVAEDALELIEVDYEPLPAVVDSEKAARSGSPILHEEHGSNVVYRDLFDWGDVEGDFKTADSVFEETFRWHRHSGTPIETAGTVASFDPITGELDLWSNWTQPASYPALAHILGIPSHRVKVHIDVDIGGAYGQKHFIYRHVVLTSLLSMTTGRPVKFCETRSYSLKSGDNHAEDRIYDVALAVKKDGTFMSMKVKVIDDLGAYPVLGPATNFNALSQITGPYKIRSCRQDLTIVVTNKCPQGVYRGAGAPPLVFCLERLVDHAAKELGLDRREIRLRNFIQPNEFPYYIPTGNVYDSGNYRAVLKKAIEIADYEGLKKLQKELRTNGRYIGIGLASSQLRSVYSMTEAWFAAPEREIVGKPSNSSESVSVKVDPSGKFIVGLHSMDTGMGWSTIASQIIADEFGVSPEDIAVVTIDVPLSAPALGGGGSRMAVMLSGALGGAVKELKRKLVKIAAHKLEASEQDVILEKGKLMVRGAPQKSYTIAQLAETAYYKPLDLPEGMRDELQMLVATYTHDHPYHTYPDEERRGVFYPIMSHACHVPVVEVDPETGAITILKYVAVHDCGTLVNPTIVEGQIHGATAQGIGATLSEHLVYSEDGQLLSGSFGDYLTPRSVDMPKDFLVDFVQTPSPYTYRGVKGAGEGGRMASPAALASAVEDALEPFGVKINELPLTPSKVCELIKNAPGKGIGNRGHQK